MIDLERDRPGIGLLARGVKFIHAAELDPLVERGSCEPARVDARLAGSQDSGMTRHLLVPVGWSNRHQLCAGTVNGKQNGVME